MDRCSHSSTKIGWARVDVTILGIKAEVLSRFLLDRVTNSLDSSCKSLKDTLDITSLLHGDNSELILFINPNEEGLGIIVEDTTSLRPISFHTSNSKISITRNKQEMIINKLLSDLLIHSSKRVVFSSKITREGRCSTLHEALNSKTLILSDSRRQSKSINGSTNSDSCRMDWDISIDISLDLWSIHVRCVLRVSRDSMIFLDDWVKDWSKVLVWIPVTSIDSTMLVVKFNSTGNSLNQCKSRCLSLDSLKLLPFVLCDMLGNKGVWRLDVGEWTICLSWHCKVKSLSLLELLVFLPKLVDTINHFLDKFNFRVSKSVLVGNVISMTSLTTRLSTSSTWLKMKFLTSGLELVNTKLSPSWEINMDRCSHSSTKIGWARVDVTILGIKAEVLSRFLLDRVTNSLDSSCKSLKDTLDITSLLHGDNSELILFINPNEEGLGIIVEDTTSLRPISFHTSNSKISITRNKQEMIINKLLSDLLIHSSKRVVFSSKITREGRCSTLHEALNSKTLILSDSRRQSKSINGSTNSDSCRMDWDISIDISLDLWSIHVRCVLRVSRDSMIFLDDWVKDWSKVLVWIPVTSIDSTMLVVKFNSTGNSLNQCKSRCLSLDSLQLLPFVLCDMLCNKGVCRLDVGEWTIGLCWHCLILRASSL